MTLELPLNNGNETLSNSRKQIDILREYLSESMFCLEFDVQKLDFADTDNPASHENHSFRVID